MAKISANTGTLYGLGVGPGDPELITLKALRLLKAAPVIAYPAPEEGESLARKIAAPHLPGGQTEIVIRMPLDASRFPAQAVYDRVAEEVATHLDAGRDVAALCEGDPFFYGSFMYLFGRLAGDHRVEVVPGVTAATACAAALGVPLTHRDHASAVTLVTGHGRDGEPELDWAALAGPRQTLAVYMGVAAAGRIAARLIAQGLAPGTPVAVIENGTMADQKTAAGALRDLEALVRDNGITGPALIIIGEVARRAQAEALAERPRALAV